MHGMVWYGIWYWVWYGMVWYGKVKVLSLPETIKEKSTFRAKAFRRVLVVLLTPDDGPSLKTPIDFSFVISGCERTFTFCVSLNTLPTLKTLLRDMVWYGVVWCGMVCCGVVWCGVAWCGVVWYGVVWYGMVW